MNIEILFNRFNQNKVVAPGEAAAYLASIAPCECDKAFLFSFIDVPNAKGIVDDIACIIEVLGVDNIHILESGIDCVFFLGYLEGYSKRYNECKIYSSIRDYLNKSLDDGIVRVQLYKGVKYYNKMHKMTAESCLFDQFVNKNYPFEYNINKA